MDRAQRENVGHPQPIPRRHQRVHRLHDVNRRHGEDRYHPYARELENVGDQRARAHPQYYNTIGLQSITDGSGSDLTHTIEQMPGV